MDAQKGRPRGEQPRGPGGIGNQTPSGANQHVSDLQADGNSCAQDVHKLEAEADALEALVASMRADIQASERRFRIFDAIIDSDFSADEKVAFLKEACK